MKKYTAYWQSFIGFSLLWLIAYIAGTRYIPTTKHETADLDSFAVSVYGILRLRWPLYLLLIIVVGLLVLWLPGRVRFLEGWARLQHGSRRKFLLAWYCLVAVLLGPLLLYIWQPSEFLLSLSTGTLQFRYQPESDPLGSFTLHVPLMIIGSFTCLALFASTWESISRFRGWPDVKFRAGLVLLFSVAYLALGLLNDHSIYWFLACLANLPTTIAIVVLLKWSKSSIRSTQKGVVIPALLLLLLPAALLYWASCSAFPVSRILIATAAFGGITLLALAFIGSRERYTVSSKFMKRRIAISRVQLVKPVRPQVSRDPASWRDGINLSFQLAYWRIADAAINILQGIGTAIKWVLVNLANLAILFAIHIKYVLLYLRYNQKLWIDMTKKAAYP